MQSMWVVMNTVSRRQSRAGILALPLTSLPAVVPTTPIGVGCRARELLPDRLRKILGYASLILVPQCELPHAGGGGRRVWSPCFLSSHFVPAGRLVRRRGTFSTAIFALELTWLARC
jgi:hypothetical protein